jgi:hypothetical protein
LIHALIEGISGPALVTVLAPIAGTFVYISLSSPLREPGRWNFNVIFVSLETLRSTPLTAGR